MILKSIICKVSTQVLAVAALTGCASLPPQLSTSRPAYNGPIPIVVATPADAALECLSFTPEVRNSNRVFSVHLISDLTQKIEIDAAGAYIPRDTAGMLVTSLSRAGVNQVNRINTTVTEFEISRAREQILGDGRSTVVEGETLPYRPLERGSLRGSDVVIDGAITQLDFNTYSGGYEGSFFGLRGGQRNFALTVAADLRVTDTRSSELLMAEAYSKQAVGREVSGSVFRFFDSELFDVQIGSKSQEGLHAGIRWMLAEAAYDIVSTTVKHDGSCDSFLPQNRLQPVQVAAAVTQ
ncbi:MAG: curli biogenesis system outer membrane secretion channel CsgG [Loktanella salsilacus]|jgi:curli biogenesis system outer membrane secretion channel CsgG